MADIKKLVQRSKKVAFYKVDDKYERMTGFTSMSKSSNPKEYSRQYVDEDGEVTDVTGYSPSIDYAFDQYENNAVHDDIVAITEDELMGSDAVREIVIVDFTKQDTEKLDLKRANVNMQLFHQLTAMELMRIPIRVHLNLSQV